MLTVGAVSKCLQDHTQIDVLGLPELIIKVFMLLIAPFKAERLFSIELSS